VSTRASWASACFQLVVICPSTGVLRLCESRRGRARLPGRGHGPVCPRWCRWPATAVSLSRRRWGKCPRFLMILRSSRNQPATEVRSTRPVRWWTCLYASLVALAVVLSSHALGKLRMTGETPDRDARRRVIQTAASAATATTKILVRPAHLRCPIPCPAARPTRYPRGAAGSRAGCSRQTRVEAAEDDPSRDQDHLVHREDAFCGCREAGRRGKCHTAMMTATAAPARRNPNRACRAGNANPV
jgi:hypothetical protein